MRFRLTRLTYTLKNLAALCLVSAAALLLPLQASLAQAPSLTFAASTTTGNGTLTTDLTWSTSPALAGTPCVASGDPLWTGAKAGSGTLNGLTFSTSGSLPLSLTCTFPADNTATVTWTNPTQNTDGSPLTNLTNVRLKWTFNPSITPSTTCGTGETCIDVSQTPVPVTSRTITGITQTGTFRVAGLAQNGQGNFSLLSMSATKTFTGSTTPITKTVTLTINPVPNTLSNIGVN